MRVFLRVFLFAVPLIRLCVGSSPIGSKAALIVKTITVDGAGHGDFRTVQSAIDSIPVNNPGWICVYVKAGTYREKVTIPIDKPFILLEGEARSKTTIVYSDTLKDLNSATFNSLASNFVAKRITFKNSYTPDTGDLKQAVAMLVGGDKSSFYDCGFIGVQDTLYDYLGRHYFDNCYIEGFDDFIFGMGQSIYKNCAIYVNGVGQNGWITAQGRMTEQDTNGFVFESCSVYGTGKAYLGRPWNVHSRVIFSRTYMSDIVIPEGWDASKFKGQEANFVFAEWNSNGPGANPLKRVKWANKLNINEFRMFTDIAFIDKEGWLPQQP